MPPSRPALVPRASNSLGCKVLRVCPAVSWAYRCTQRGVPLGKEPRESSCHGSSVNKGSGSEPLRGPSTRTSRVFGMARPASCTRGPGQTSRACSEFSWHRYRDSRGAFRGHAAPQPHDIGVRDDAVSDLDLEVIGRIACTAPCVDRKSPRSIVNGRSACGIGCHRDGRDGERYSDKFGDHTWTRRHRPTDNLNCCT